MRSEKKIDSLIKAAKIAKDIFASVSVKIKPGAREIEIKRAIESKIKEKGLKRSFETIVASGPNAAKPHAKVTERTLRSGDAVVVDLGVKYKGYCSDLTRTVKLGKINAKMEKLYETVKAAQRLAIRNVKPGLKIKILAALAQDYMRKKGFGKYILHTLGHGVGKRIHQGPRLSEKNERFLQKGMVITIEPGLYIKNRGGARIEDMVLVTAKGGRVLTR
ncbi:MAG: M24 family metallopeptidase [Candidatus Omnitrophica bacterium]|nr:M24 family metallopeptidase [Candidatus Omnitrophota bacterium]